MKWELGDNHEVNGLLMCVWTPNSASISESVIQINVNLDDLFLVFFKDKYIFLIFVSFVITSLSFFPTNICHHKIRKELLF